MEIPYHTNDISRDGPVFGQCDYLPFNNTSFVWNEYDLCYGQSMYSDMADGSSTFILGDLVGQESFGDPKVVVILFSASWCNPCYNMLPEIDSMVSYIQNSMELNGIDESEFVFIDYLIDEYQPYSCTQWGNYGTEGSPPIISGGSLENNSLYYSFLDGGDDGGGYTFPFMVIIDRDGRYIDGGSGNWTHSDTTWNKIKGLILNTWNPCEIMGCMNISADNYDPDAVIDDGSCEFFEPGTVGPDGYYIPDTFVSCEEGVGILLWGECYNIEETISLNLTGQWPPDGTGLTGPIPDNLSLLVNLEYLILQLNNLSGTMNPDTFLPLTNLKNLSLNVNDLSGTINLPWISNPQLTVLNLSANQFTGEIPIQILQFYTTMKFLLLSYNNLTGEIPSWIGDMSELQSLDLSGNQLTGQIPPEIGNLVNMGGGGGTLKLNNNPLTGPIPDSVCDLIESNGLNIDDIITNTNLENTCDGGRPRMKLPPYLKTNRVVK